MAQTVRSLENNKCNVCNCIVRFSLMLDSKSITNVSIQKHETVTVDEDKKSK